MAVAPFDLHLASQHSEWPLRYHSIAAPLLASIPMPAPDVQCMLDKGTCAPVYEKAQNIVFGPDGVFIKLAGFNFRGHPAFDLLSGQIKSRDDLALLCSSLPGRVRWALHQCAKRGDPVLLDVFRWRPIPPESEIRLEVQARAVTHILHYRTSAQVTDPGQIHLAHDLFAWMVPDLPLDDCLIDVTTHYPAARLIEINPLRL